MDLETSQAVRGTAGDICPGTTAAWGVEATATVRTLATVGCTAMMGLATALVRRDWGEDRAEDTVVAGGMEELKVALMVITATVAM